MNYGRHPIVIYKLSNQQFCPPLWTVGRHLFALYDRAERGQLVRVCDLLCDQLGVTVGHLSFFSHADKLHK